jgi:hypothetical protein
MPATPLPPELAALSRRAPGALTPLSVRLDAATLAEVDQLAKQLNRAERAAVLRYLIATGLAATREQLEAAA